MTDYLSDCLPEPSSECLSGTDRPSAPSLTTRQEAFARHYVACGNGAEAARRAGYSVDNARFIARDNLKKDPVRQRIRALAAAREAQTRDEAGYLVMMLNAAMEMALRQEQPNPMIRALALMARMTGLDRPAPVLPVDGEDDAALALPADTRAGLIQEAVLAAADAKLAANTQNEPLNDNLSDSLNEPGADSTKDHKTPHPEDIAAVTRDPSRNATPALNRSLRSGSELAAKSRRCAAATAGGVGAWAPDRASAGTQSKGGDKQFREPTVEPKDGLNGGHPTDVAPALSRGLCGDEAGARPPAKSRRLRVPA